MKNNHFVAIYTLHTKNTNVYMWCGKCTDVRGKGGLYTFAMSILSDNFNLNKLFPFKGIFCLRSIDIISKFVVNLRLIVYFYSKWLPPPLHWQTRSKTVCLKLSANYHRWQDLEFDNNKYIRCNVSEALLFLKGNIFVNTLKRVRF